MMKTLTEEELREVERWLDARLPKSVIMKVWISMNLRRLGKVGTSDNAVCYVDRWPSPRIVTGVDVVEMFHVSHFPICSMYIDVGLEDAEIVERFLIELAQALGLLDIGGFHPQAISAEWCPTFDKLFAKRLGLNARIDRWPCKAYWLDEEKQRQVRNQIIEAPEGFEFGTLKLSDAQYVDDMWIHHFVGSRKLIERRIRHFPTVCLRESGPDKRLASFELVNDVIGVQNHLYTVPDFRRKGLATLVELKLSQTMLERDHLPVKTVVIGNTSGEKITEVSPVWSHAEDVTWLRYGDERMVKAYSEMDSTSTHE